MEHVQLGSASVPRVGVGTATFSGHWGRVEEDSLVDAIRAADEAGLRFFDTADCYGLGYAEELLAKTLGSRRTDCVISTKGGVRWDTSKRTWRDSSPAYLQSAIDSSLRRLQIETIPLYYLHWMDGETPLESSLEALADAQAVGKIIDIGLSNVTLEQLQRAIALVPVAAVQLQLSLVNRAVLETVVPFCANSGVGVVTWGSLAQGILGGVPDRSRVYDDFDRRPRDANFLGEKFERNMSASAAVVGIANRIGRTPAQVALRWLLDTPGVAVALAGAKRREHVRDYRGALDWRLEADDYAALAAISNK